jgi:asparagine synthase (glutamine-hydrolysing)
MAGIAGWVARRARDEAPLGAMAAALAHRARPGETLEGVVDADARRQAVLGATLHDAASGIALVLDGTLANAGELKSELARHGFSFARGSDEEVLLRAYQYWDKDVVKQLRGAFAFAVWDARKERLLLARDRFGEKPLYLCEANGALHFASEPKALLAAGVPARADLGAVWDCLAQRYVPGPRTLFAGVRKLRAASYALWQFGRLHEARYWTPPDRQPHCGATTKGDAVEGFLGALHEAVKLHAADGVFLSGGLDSAVLVALKALEGGCPRTYSLGFAGGKRDGAAGELREAARVARHFATLHQEIVVAPGELASGLPRLVALRDAPLARPSDLAVHRLACEAARTARTVLTGDGSDEILGGYRRYIAESHGLPMRLFAPLVSGGRFDTAAGPVRLEPWRRRISVLEGDAPGKDEADAHASPLRSALYRDQTGWLPDQVLERTERATMAVSLEARMPFLDHRVAEYVSRLPDAQRVRGLTTKWILRAAARRVLPKALARRRKGGWRVNAAGWLRNELRELTMDHLQGPSSVTRAYYDAPTLDRVLADHLQGKKNHETLLWTLLNIEIWHRTYTPG